MRILLIEDNKEISNNIKQYFELEDYSVTQCFDGVTGLDEARVNSYDIILLDVMLPELDGLNLAKKLQWRVNIPIIMITAREGIEDKLKWFDAWIVDYIVKPFDLRELEARIKVILWKNKDIIIFWETELNFKDRIFKKQWISVNLTKTEVLILEYLANNRDKVLARGEIIENIWWENAIFDADPKLDVYISMIRNKLCKNIIKTSKWFWYQFWEEKT